jgi:hypothetical protein
VNVVIRQLRHRFHDDRELLHPRHILDYVKLGPSNSDEFSRFRGTKLTGVRC